MYAALLSKSGRENSALSRYAQATPDTEPQPARCAIQRSLTSLGICARLRGATKLAPTHFNEAVTAGREGASTLPRRSREQHEVLLLEPAARLMQQSKRQTRPSRHLRHNGEIYTPRRGKTQDIALRQDSTRQITSGSRVRVSVCVSSTAGSGKYPERDGGEERRDRGGIVRQMTGRGSEAKGSGGNARRIETERLRRIEAETAYEMVMSKTAPRRRECYRSSAAPSRTHARLAATPPMPVPTPMIIPNGCAESAALVVVGGGGEELTGAVVEVEADPDSEDAETEAEVDDGTKDGKESEVGLVAAAQNCSTPASAEATSAGGTR
ncbi:hypothetical protein FB451DRAFT_1191821 [Mycena latifolia]|nr:hypothetical protein FB451DRAFT_1191821 [Mycena latifolia]